LFFFHAFIDTQLKGRVKKGFFRSMVKSAAIKSVGEKKGGQMNLDPAMAAGYVTVAVGGFAFGALVGRWMLAEMSTALGSVQLRLSALEQKVIGRSATAGAALAANGNSAAPQHAP
jgi:hypothetical protein